MINTNDGKIKQWSKNEFYQFVADIFIKTHYDYISDYIKAHRYSKTILVSFCNNEFHLGVKGHNKQKLISLDNPWRSIKNIPDSVKYIVNSYFHYLTLYDIAKYILPLEEFNCIDVATKIINNFLLLNQLDNSYFPISSSSENELCRNYLGQHINVTTECLLANYNTITSVLKANSNNIIELIKIFKWTQDIDNIEQSARMWNIYQTLIYQLVLACNPTNKTIKAYLKLFCKLTIDFSLFNNYYNITLPTSCKLSSKWLNALLAVNSVAPDTNFYWKIEFENEDDVRELLNNLPITNANDDLFAFGIDYVSELYDSVVIKDGKQVISKSNPKTKLYHVDLLKNGQIIFINADKYTTIVQKWLDKHPEVNQTINGSRNDKIYQILHTIFKQLPNN